MKRITYLLLITVALVTLSCSSDDSGENSETISELKQYNLELKGSYVLNFCEEASVSTIKIEFLEEGSIANTLNSSSDIEGNDSFTENLNGELIGVKITLPNYQQGSDEGLGEGFDITSFVIKNNQDDSILFETNPNGWLIHCSDICPEITLLYNISTEEFSNEPVWL